MKTFLEQDIESFKLLSGKKFLITGGKGMLGSSFVNQLSKNVKNAKVYSFDKKNLDVSNINSVNKYLDIQPDYIIHCAALVNADECERNYENGKKIIVDGTQNIIDFAKKTNSKIFYPQSFLIYNYTNKIIDENTKPMPLNKYGKLKLEAENSILRSSLEYLSIRMGGFFGGFQKDNNFVGKITTHISNLIKNKKKSIEIGDRVWQPSYTEDLAYNSLLLLSKEKIGQYCMASHGSCSFFDLTKKIINILKIGNLFEVNSVSAEILAKKEIAVRPISAIMNNNKLIKEKLDRQRKWEVSLEEYLDSPYFRNLFK